MPGSRRRLAGQVFPSSWEMRTVRSRRVLYLPVSVRLLRIVASISGNPATPLVLALISLSKTLPCRPQIFERRGDFDGLGKRDAVVVGADVEAAGVIEAVKQVDCARGGVGDGEWVIDGDASLLWWLHNPSRGVERRAAVGAAAEHDVN